MMTHIYSREIIDVFPDWTQKLINVFFTDAVQARFFLDFALL